MLPSIASGEPDAYQIFEHAKRVLQSQSYPDPISYRTTVQVSEGERTESEHFHAEAFSGGDVRVEGVSDEEQVAPRESIGVNFKFSLSIGWNTGAGGQAETATEDAHRKEASPDYMGVPLVSPNYWFGLTSQQTAFPTPSPSSTLSLRTIATVTATNRAYVVTLVDTDTIGGLYTYHLHLEPVSRPDRYRIRELWIDLYTFQIVQLQTQGNFTNPPMSDVPWLVTFQSVNGDLYIEKETALAPLAFRHDRTFSAASISFDDIRATGDAQTILPIFDSKAALREPQGQ